MSCLFCRLGTCRHGDTAVGILDSQNIVHAVADHSDGLAVGLPCLHKCLFLLRPHASEYAVF